MLPLMNDVPPSLAMPHRMVKACCMFEDDLDSVADALDVMMTPAAFEAPKTGGPPPEDLARGFSGPHASSAVPCGD